MSEVQPIIIYLAGPIDDVPIETAREWRRDLSLSLPHNVVLFSPAHAYFNGNPETFPKIDHFNRRVIYAADGLLANLTGSGRGFGTIREIEHAVNSSTPVAVAGDIVSYMAHDVIVRPTVDEAFNALLQKIAELRDVPPHMMFGPFVIPFQQPDPPEEED